MNNRICAYCGQPALELDKEHVFPKCLYPPSKAQSKVQRLTIPSCKSCNNSWSDDEVHFRNILTIAGEQPNSSRVELFKEKVIPSFYEVDGSRRRNDLLERLKQIKMSDGSVRQKVYPGEDEKVVRVVKKVIRGLCYYHNILWPVPDQLLWVDVLKYEIPQEFIDNMEYHNRELDIAEYYYQVINDNEIGSVWIITFYQKVTFLGLVSISKNSCLNRK
jgi:hypothetical protein